MTVNVEKLRAVLEFVTSQPDRWDQAHWLAVPYEALAGGGREPGADWTCGTTACVAGWVALRAGWEPRVCRWSDEPDDFDHDAEQVVDHRTGEVQVVFAVAQRELGLTRAAAGLLFHGDNTLRDLWEYARAFTGGAIEVPAGVLAAESHPFVFDPTEPYARAAIEELRELREAAAGSAS